MIDTQEQFVGLLLPARIAFARRKVNDFQIVTVGIFEVKGVDAGGCFEVGTADAARFDAQDEVGCARRWVWVFDAETSDRCCAIRQESAFPPARDIAPARSSRRRASCALRACAGRTRPATFHIPFRALRRR